MSDQIKPAHTMTREHPILFSAPMVRAILSDDKTQARRIVKTPMVLDMPDGHT